MAFQWTQWSGAVRFVVPDYIVAVLRKNPLCCDLYPLSFGYYPRAQGHAMVREEHHDHLLIYCVDGGGDLQVEGRPHRVSKGDLVLLPRDCVHAYQADDDNPWSVFWVHFEGTLSDAFIQNFGYSFEQPTLRLGILPRVVDDFETMLAVRQSGFSQKIYIHVANHLRRLLTYIAIQVSRAVPHSDLLNLDEIHGQMMHHLHGHLDLEQLASHVNLTRHYFAKRYKAVTGRSPIQQFIQFKMDHARYMLDTTARPVNSIARELGYDDAYYFSRLFKKVVGLSPREYRRMRGR